MCKKEHYVLLQDLVVFECFTKFYGSLLKIRLQSSKLFQTDMDCTQTAQKIQTPLHVHLEVTFICTFLAYDIKEYRKFPIQPLFISNLLLYICKYSTKAIIHFEGMLHTQNWNFFNNVINTKRELILRDNVINYGIRKAGYLMSVKKQ